ncbi:unknown [Ruminococcus sp. CAG:382]|nr:unknown [Ruminococcus sp. CAG:382]
MISHKVGQLVVKKNHDAASNYKVSDCIYYYPYFNCNINSQKMQ